MAGRFAWLTGINQQVVNNAKAGAFYTDLEHCRRINMQLKIAEDQTIYALDPSIGDAGGILTALDRKSHPNIKVFGCELRRDAADDTSKNPLIDTCLCADYLREIKVSHNGFDVVFANPPYGMTPDGKGRLETAFLQKIYQQLCNKGLLIWIVPSAVFREDSHNEFIRKRFFIERMFRFDEREFKKYHQICLFLRKDLVSPSMEADLAYLGEVENALKLSCLPESCPEGEKLLVEGSDVVRLKIFQTQALDTERAYAALFEHEKKEGSEGLFVQKFEENQHITIPKMPSKDSIYMMMSGGVGGGMCGDERHQHLQRGVVTEEKAQKIEIQKNADGEERRVLTERTYHSAMISVIQADGSITRLTGTADEE